MLLALMLRWDEWLADAAKRTAYGWEATKCIYVGSAIGAFKAAWEAYQANKTKENCLDKDVKKELAIEAMRLFATNSIRTNDKMTAAERLYLGVGPLDTSYTFQGDPTKPPLVTLFVKGYCQIGTRLQAEGTDRVAIPDWASGGVLLMQVGGERPASPEDLPIVGLMTRARHTIQCNGKDCGKKAYISYQWQNSKGQKGPPAPIQEITIP
jgi:hypothetical protein